MIKFKSFRLVPTSIILDVWITKDDKGLCSIFRSRYGGTPQYWGKDMEEVAGYPRVKDIKTKGKAELKSKYVIFMVLTDSNKQTIVHEISHVVDRLCSMCRLEDSIQASEWRAWMTDYIYEEITGKGYEERTA